MTRGVGEIEVAQRLVPDVLYPLVETVTRLGDVSVLAAVTVVATVVLRRDRALSFLGTVIGGFAILGGLKAALALGRPPADLQLIETATTGFPSGHALGAAVVYGGLALSLEGRRRRLALAVVGPVVAAIGLSRIVLGVHYLVDVVVGGGVAVGYLLVTERVRRIDPTRQLHLAAGLGLVAVVAGYLFGPTPRTDCLGTLCLDTDTVVPAAAGIGAVLMVESDRGLLTADRRRWQLLLPVAIIGGVGLAVTGSVLLSSGLVAALAGAGLVVLAGRGAPFWAS